MFETQVCNCGRAEVDADNGPSVARHGHVQLQLRVAYPKLQRAAMHSVKSYGQSKSTKTLGQ